MSSRTLSLFSALALLALIGCGDGATDPPADMGGSADGGMMSCTNNCLDGETKCLNELFILTCQVGANGCREFSNNYQKCGVGQMCNVSTSMCESDGKPVECVSNCEFGDGPRCSARGEVEECANRDGEECFTYEVSKKCTGEQVCNDGACAAPVCDQTPCTLGATQCEGELVQTCVMKNGCAVFSAATDCPAGNVCTGSACQKAASCEDECIVGADKLCAPGGVPRICETSAEGCGAYKDLAVCEGSKVCEKGECIAEVTCPDDACDVPNARDCSPTGSVRECIFASGSDCGEWNVVEMCVANGFICNETGPFVQCEPPPMMSSPVVINEIFYNVPGADVDANMESKSFIELQGAPGQNIENWELRLVNGKNGMTYRSVVFPSGSSIGSNGYALIVTDKASPYLNLQAFLGVSFVGEIPATATDDGIQNGPDNVELYNAMGTKVDALGYGDFEGGDVFTGEGTSPGRIFENRSLGRHKGAPDTDDNSVDFISLYPTPGDDNGDLLINEIYVDQPGTDGVPGKIETFIELRAPITDDSWVNMELDQYNLRAINGLNGMDYILSGVNPGVDFSGAFLQDVKSVTGDVRHEGMVLICNIEASNAVIGLCSVPYEGADYQNGPDNFVLEYQGRVIDAIAYGSFSGTDVNVGEGMSVPLSSSSVGKSLNRTNDYSKPIDTDDNAADFYLADPSPAVKNARP